MLENIIVCIIVGIVVAIAVKSLYRTLSGKKGGCSGCSGCASQAHCNASTEKDRPDGQSKGGTGR